MVISYDHVAEIYDETRRIPNSILGEFYKIVLNRVRFDKNSIILDAGVGTGRTIIPLLACRVKLVGIDISRNMLQKLLEKIDKKNISTQFHLILGDVTNIPSGDSIFDLVIAVHILHLVNWKKCISEIRRVLKTDGYLIVGNSGAGELQTVVGQKYVELLDKYVNRKTLRYLLWKNFLAKIYEIKLLGHLLNIVKKHENLQTFLRSNACFFEKHIIKWNEKYESFNVLKRLERHVFSFQWNIPIKVHKEIMQKLKKWINKRRKRQPFVEKIERQFEVFVVKFK